MIKLAVLYNLQYDIMPFFFINILSDLLNILRNPLQNPQVWFSLVQN